MEAAKEKDLSLERLAQLSGVSDRFLKLLIEEKFQKLPPQPYLRGYLLKIAEVLDLDGEALWQKHLKDNDIIRRSGEKDQLPHNRFAVSALGQRTVWGLGLIAVLIVYIIVRIFLFSAHFEFSLENLEDNLVVATSTYVIRGETNSGYQLTINGAPVYPQEDGRFEYTLNLEPGFNTATVRIKKVLGDEKTVIRQIFYEAPAGAAGTSTRPAITD